jgi:hypothetical protein
MLRLSRGPPENEDVAQEGFALDGLVAFIEDPALQRLLRPQGQRRERRR